MGRASQAVNVTGDQDRFGEALSYLNGRFACKVSAKDTGGDLCIYDTVRTERGGPPLHLHHDQDEWFFVREGEFVFLVGAQRYRLGPGDSVLAPRKVPHAFANVSDAGRLLIVYQPAGTIEQFFREGVAMTNASAEERAAHARSHGLELVGPPLNLE
jgi:mannose-6-phosphate isomerase-like protein (cupin superfamily)